MTGAGRPGDEVPGDEVPGDELPGDAVPGLPCTPATKISLLRMAAHRPLRSGHVSWKQRSMSARSLRSVQRHSAAFPFARVHAVRSLWSTSETCCEHRRMQSLCAAGESGTSGNEALRPSSVSPGEDRPAATPPGGTGAGLALGSVAWPGDLESPNACVPKMAAHRPASGGHVL